MIKIIKILKQVQDDTVGGFAKIELSFFLTKFREKPIELRPSVREPAAAARAVIAHFAKL